MKRIEHYFGFEEKQTNFKTELMAGVTTFLTMAYIIFLQPAILSGVLFDMDTGMDFGSVMVATCVASAVATAIMGLYANYPIAQAPGMGENFFFVFSLLPAAATMAAVQSGATSPWQVGLGVIFISGILFLIISLTGVREHIVNAISPNLKNGIAVGIGLFIAFIGMRNATLIVDDPGTAVKLNIHFLSPDLMLFFFGLFVTAAMCTRKIRGAIFWGIVITTIAAVVLKLLIPHLPACVGESKVVQASMLMTRFEVMHGIVSLPPSVKPTLFKMDVVSALTWKMVPFIIIFLFMDVFDTIGTLIGVGEQAGFIKDNKLPRARQAMLSDAVGTTLGGCMGTSTVTSFIESTTGVEYGGRTGMTGLAVAALFLLALFFSPIVKMVGSYAPITAPALVVVGTMMIRNVVKICWDDYSEAVPAFLIMVGIPFTYSIGDGLALGFISYPIIKLLSGKGRDVQPATYLLCLILLAYFIVIRA